MELRALNDFLAIAREENITRTAEQLHVTPPTLSRQCADLEEVPGVKLCYNIVIPFAFSGRSRLLSFFCQLLTDELIDFLCL